MLEVGGIDEARSACEELKEIADSLSAGALRAMAGQARGLVLLAVGNPGAALCSLKEACEFWREAQVPYLMARVRELMGMACRLLGDEDGARLELEAQVLCSRNSARSRTLLACLRIRVLRKSYSWPDKARAAGSAAGGGRQN